MSSNTSVNCNNKYNSKSTKKSNVLLVEDSEFVNNAIKKELDGLGYDCMQALSLEEAMQLLKENVYEFIVLDLHLPDAYGEKLFLAVTTHSDAKVIILTSEQDVDIRNSLFKFGALDYVLKDKNFIKSIHKIDDMINSIEANKEFSILVIDDSSLVRKQIEMILKVRNYQLYLAQTAQDGLDMLENSEIDLVILDLELPDIPGLKVLQRIKNNPEHCALPVMILSGTNDPDLISSVLKGGASDFVHKPFNIEEFTLKINLWTQLSNKKNEVHCLEQLLTQYKSILNDRNMVMKIDKYGVIKEANKNFCDFFAYNKHELIGESCDVLHNDAETFSTFLNKLQSSRDKKKKINMNIKKKDGNTENINLNITLIHNNKGELFEYIIVYG
ncbi:response regulator [Sulfurimonas aquatica]|uniref:Response regulator n=1 Tax=Sulfurimonas aquatica TaxID=2672570 RepID=A0A975B0M5_9BACT|nr:response regulator [Sulfurimonas aquatica]QSZ42027.1 response regulator [Sulfurimonas aquatica]